MSATILVPDIIVDGTGLDVLDPDADLVELRVVRSTGAAASAQLWLDMTNSDGDSIQIGSKLVIDVVSLEGVQAGGSIFIGSVTSIGIEVEARRTQLIIGAHDASYALGRKTVSTSRLNMSAKAIISAIAQDFGLRTQIDGDLGSDQLLHVQETGTAHQVVTDIARTFGCEWFVEDDTLIVRRRTTSTPITISGDEHLRRFSARFSSIEQASSISVRQWDSDQQDTVIVAADLATGATLAGSNVPITQRGRSNSTATHEADVGVAMPGMVVGAASAEKLAKGILGRNEAAMLTGRGEVDVRSDLVPGAQIKLEEVKTEWNGTYYVTSVEHVFGDNKPFATRFTLGGLDPTTLVDVLGSGPAGTRDRMASGLAIGIVTDNEDPDGLSRVKVRLPMLSDDNESWWTRLVSPGGGTGRGWVIVPEIGDEVVVAFAHSDINQPYVLGGLWNGQHAVPDVQGLINNSSVESRAFVSRLGHRLEFRDGTGDADQFIELKMDNTTTKLYLGADKIELHSADKAIQVQTNDATIDLTEQGDIEMTANNIKIHATQKLELITDSGDISVTSGMNANVKASIKVAIEGSAGASLKSSAITEVKGSMVNIN